jgi:hypothetical protein
VGGLVHRLVGCRLGSLFDGHPHGLKKYLHPREPAWLPPPRYPTTCTSPPPADPGPTIVAPSRRSNSAASLRAASELSPPDPRPLLGESSAVGAHSMCWTGPNGRRHRWPPRAHCRRPQRVATTVDAAGCRAAEDAALGCQDTAP